MENQSYEYRNWGELIADALVLIITKLTLRDKLHSIPIVCKPWYKVITSSPHCWLDIDFDELFDDFHIQHIQVMSVRMRLLQLLPILLRRCSPKFHSFSCSKYLNASSLSLLANSGTESLRTLKMPWTDLSNDETIFESVARKLSNLTYLDISHCSGIGVEGL
ncbi:F-box protein FBW2-like [Cannabis sativa]|uniref:F-box protein FBW2-like n=1 Tax=Cannabis sativa TaxID=3483 RepID=UPI0029CA9AAF|nr:F-box protein FBW2-like [Cannabis sativa]